PLLAWGVEAVDRYKAARQLARALPADHAHREVRVATLNWFQPSLVFYTRRQVERLEHPIEAITFLDQPLPAYLFVPEQTWIELGRTGNMKAHVVGGHRDLYTGRVVLLVANEPAAR